MSNDTPIARDQLPDPPWDRVDRDDLNESDQAFGAFARYRDMGYDRSLAKVAHELGKSKSLMERWSRRWQWRFRVEEWDRDQELQKSLAMNDSIQKMAERHAAQAAAAIQGMMLPHMALARKMRDNPDLVETLSISSPGELIRLAQSTSHALTVLMNAERLARGEPIEIVQTQGRQDVTMDVHISDSELEATAAVLREAGFFDDFADTGEASDSEDAGDSPEA